MWPRIIAEIVTASALAIGRAVGKAFREEYVETQQAWRNIQHQSRSEAAEDAETKSATMRSGISVAEAVQILNLQEPICEEKIEKSFEYLHSINNKDNGGSKYLQAKVYNARIRLLEELARTKKLDS